MNFLIIEKFKELFPSTLIIHRTIESIVETRDGEVFLNFRKELPQILRNLSSRSDLPYKVSLPPNARPSVSAPSVISESRDNDDDNISVKGIRISPNQIPHGVYQKQSNIRRTSPTASEVNFSL